jgi:hypothetical protein
MTGHTDRLTRLSKLEETHAPEAASVPVVLVNDGETSEQAAVRHGVDPTARMVLLTVHDARNPNAPR